MCLYGDVAGLVKATFFSFTVQRVHITFLHCLLVEYRHGRIINKVHKDTVVFI